MEKDKGIRENLFPNQIVVFSGIKTEAKSRKWRIAGHAASE
jgi:hypothetical protein